MAPRWLGDALLLMALPFKHAVFAAKGSLAAIGVELSNTIKGTRRFWIGAHAVKTIFSKRAQIIRVAVLIMAWYLLSLSLTACNKILLDSLAFPYPLFVTFIHFAGVAILIRTTQVWILRLPPPAVDPLTFVSKIIPISFLSAMEIALSNQAYSMVSLSVMTVVKSTVVAATYAASILIGTEQFRYDLAATLLLIISSVAYSVPGMEVQNSRGVLLLCFAVLCAAFRWAIIHKQLKGQDSISSLALITLTQPLAALCLLPMMWLYDLPDLMENIALEPADSERIVAIVVLVTAAILLVSALLYVEFRFIELTSSLTLTVAGAGKECATVAMSTILFKEVLHWEAVAGLACSLVGILIYGILRSEATAYKEPEPPNSDDHSLSIVIHPKAWSIQMTSYDSDLSRPRKSDRVIGRAQDQSPPWDIASDSSGF